MKTYTTTRSLRRPRLRPGSLLIASLLLVMGTSACQKKEEGSSGAPAGSMKKTAPDVSATRVEVAVLESSTARDRLIRPGEIVGAKEAQLASALGGYVEKVMVESGQTVTKNQVIARVDTSTHAANLALVKVEVDDAQRELERLEKMGKAIASARVDAARTRLARAKAQQRLSATQLSRATIKAPFAGVLSSLDIETGEVAAPGQPVGRLLLLDPIRVSVSVTDRDISSLKEGDTAIVTSAGSPGPIKGAITRIDPAADLRTRTFLVEVDVPNPDKRLLPGMIATVEFRPSGNEGEQLLLPQDLLVTRLDGNGVFVVDKSSKAQWRPLELGKVLGAQVEVVSGLERGERIVSTGHRSLSAGDPVIVTRHGVCCKEGRVSFDSPPAATKSTPSPTTSSPAPATPDDGKGESK